MAVVSVAIGVGLVGCSATPSTGTEAPEQEEVEPETNDSEDDAAEEAEAPADDGAEESPAPSVDRSALPWNEDVPADFPLEDVPLPTEGTMDYTELVEEDVWNVMISDIPESGHEAWVQEMGAVFGTDDEDSLTYLGPAASGVWYSIHAMVFDETDTGITMTYRIKDMGD